MKLTLSELVAAKKQEKKKLQAELKKTASEEKSLDKKRKRVMDMVNKLSDEDLEYARAEKASPKAKAKAAAKAMECEKYVKDRSALRGYIDELVLAWLQKKCNYVVVGIFHNTLFAYIELNEGAVIPGEAWAWKKSEFETRQAAEHFIKHELGAPTVLLQPPV